MSTRSNRLVRSIVLFAAVLVSSPVFAQSQEKAAAEAFFQAAKQLMADGKLEEACSKFEASQAIDPALGTLLHLGDCYERTGRTASAWATFQEAASVAQVSGQASREQIARTRAEALEPKLVRIELRLAAAERPTGMVITVAGVTIPPSSYGAAFPVDPGEARVLVRAPGFVEWSTTVRIAPDATEIQIVDVPALAPAPPEAAPRVVEAAPSVPVVAPAPAPVKIGDDRGREQRIAAIVIGSVGLAGITVGAAFGIAAMTENYASLEECRPEDPTRCTAEGVAMRELAQDYALGSTIGFSVGGGLLATGVVLYFTAPSPATREALRRMRVGAGPAGANLSLELPL